MVNENVPVKKTVSSLSSFISEQWLNYRKQICKNHKNSNDGDKQRKCAAQQIFLDQTSSEESFKKITKKSNHTYVLSSNRTSRTKIVSPEGKMIQGNLYNDQPMSSILNSTTTYHCECKKDTRRSSSNKEKERKNSKSKDPSKDPHDHCRHDCECPCMFPEDDDMSIVCRHKGCPKSEKDKKKKKKKNKCCACCQKQSSTCSCGSDTSRNSDKKRDKGRKNSEKEDKKKKKNKKNKKCKCKPECQVKESGKPNRCKKMQRKNSEAKCSCKEPEQNSEGNNGNNGGEPPAEYKDTLDSVRQMIKMESRQNYRNINQILTELKKQRKDIDELKKMCGRGSSEKRKSSTASSNGKNKTQYTCGYMMGDTSPLGVRHTTNFFEREKPEMNRNSSPNRVQEPEGKCPENSRCYRVTLDQTKPLETEPQSRICKTMNQENTRISEADKKCQENSRNSRVPESDQKKSFKHDSSPDRSEWAPQKHSYHEEKKPRAPSPERPISGKSMPKNYTKYLVKNVEKPDEDDRKSEIYTFTNWNCQQKKPKKKSFCK